MRIRTFASALVLLLASGICGVAQTADQIVKWSAKIPSQALVPGAKAYAELTAQIESGWHVYAISQLPGGPTAMAVAVPEGQPFRLTGRVISTEPEHKFDPNFDIDTAFHLDNVQLKVPLQVESAAAPGVYDVKIDVVFQTCSESMCLPPATAHLVAKAKIAPARSKTKKVFPAGRKSVGPLSEGPTVGFGSRDIHTAQRQAAVLREPSFRTALRAGLQQTGADGVSKSSWDTFPTRQSLSSFLLLAMGMGALSLLTPCVFPMIPITVSYFSNRAEGNGKSVLISAAVYSFGIILTFTALGMFLAIMFGAAGVNQLAANPWVNLLITAVFLGFAFSLFGFYFVQVPTGLMNRIDSVARSKEGTRVLGSLLMGFTFTLTSFTCTAPFVGTLLVLAAQGNWRWPFIGLLAFSTIFSIPFFLLALAPQLIRRLPKAGGWMHSVKVVMGLLEIAAAMKFLSNADAVWHWGVFTRNAVLAVWALICVTAAVYVIAFSRPHTGSPRHSFGLFRLAIIGLFLVVGVWLMSGVTGERLGEVESFLPPSGADAPAGGRARSSFPTEAGWILNNYNAAVKQAEQSRKLVLIDFTGYTCTNCRWMETNMFLRPEVAQRMRRFVRLRLYTDGTGEVCAQQQKMQEERFGTVALPFYAIVRPDGTSIATFPGLTRNTSEFLAFLQRADSRQ